MMDMGDGSCPYKFNYEAETFKIGDTISYRVPTLGDFPFAGLVKAVFDDYIEIADFSEPEKVIRATRESRPIVSEKDVLS
ncbi:MAG: hypothetical protein JKY66_02535 [Spongiibacteraceae bacterium]|nr:hypothetical protein [Spongiibacteraceae bacterium]